MASTPPASLGFTAWGKRRAGSFGSQDSGSLYDGRGRHRSSSLLAPARRSGQSQDGSPQQPPGADTRLSGSLASGSHREPIRSFINSTHRDNLAPVNSVLQARSVREDTAELATYQLADQAERRNSTVLRNRSLSFRTTVSSDAEAAEAAEADETESRAATNASATNWGSEPIEEASEPEPSPSPTSDGGGEGAQGGGRAASAAPAASAADSHPVDASEDDGGGPSLLARALRRSPPDTSHAAYDGRPRLDRPNGRLHSSELPSTAHDRDGNMAVFSDAEDDAEEEEEEAPPSIPQANGGASFRPPATESTPLLGSAGAADTPSVSGTYDLEGQKDTVPQRLLGLFGWRRRSLPGPVASQRHRSVQDRIVERYQSAVHHKCWDRAYLWQNAVVAPVSCLPAVIVGLLLNILDALSYGMILFPLGSPIFAHLGSAGISIFYVSTIVSQLVFSWGSIFRGGIGSELIEVVPFFHSMALTIVDIVGEEDPDAVIATTITSYSLSAMVTGSVFYLMGHFRFGYIVGFIPRHILIGCIGGVGWFLVATGFEVTARIDGSLNYDLETLVKLFQPDTVPLWITPLALAVVLFWGQKHITNKYFLPLYIIAIPFAFYLVALPVAGPAGPSSLRQHGWVFQGPPADEPWWFFYTLYKFDKVQWGAVVQCIPAMLALTFFGILHVPINVPALALNIGEDHADLNHELKLHGFSNFFSGCLGSIQNYLVYANTIFFMRSGGDSRLAGLELAILTFGVMLIGPKVIGFIPVMMVGCLIFDLGFELLVEAIWEPRKKLKLLEHVTVIVIVLIMGIYDFVVGIGVGILLAFVSLVFQTSQFSAVRAVYAGDTVNSTVRRNHAQHHFLRKVGRQICIIKVTGYLFFGTIVSVEQKIRELIADEAFAQRPIRYMILDLRQVTGLDYSAGEAFNTISRLLNSKDIHLVLSGIDAERSLGRDIRAVGLGEDGVDVAFLADINTALELCENELLKTLYASQNALGGAEVVKASVSMPVTASAAKATASSSSRHLGAGGNGHGKDYGGSDGYGAIDGAVDGTVDGDGDGDGEEGDGGREEGRSLLPPQAVDLLGSSPRRSLLRVAAQESLTRVEGRRQPKWQNFSEPLRLMLQVLEEMSDRNEDFWFRATRYFVRREFVAGQMLYAAGSAADGFYLLEKGIVRAEYDLPHGKSYHESIVAGTTCGELPFFSETPRTATVYADLDCVAWVLERAAWQRLQRDDPEVAQELLRVSLKLTAERMATVPSSTMLLAD